MAGARAARRRGHLGDRTAAFVDGQLTGLERAAALRHLERCDSCDVAVRAQRLLKWRMSGLAAAPVAPPASLLSRLADLGDMLGESAAGRVPDWTAPAVAPALVRARRRRALPRALLAGGLTVLAVSGAYALAPATTPTRSATPVAPPAPAVDRSPFSTAAVPSAPGAGVVRARTVGSPQLLAAVTVEPAWATTGTRSTAIPTDGALR